MSNLHLSIAAFLSRKKRTADYRVALFDWCRFLGGDLDDIQEKFIKATRTDAELYMQEISTRPGVATTKGQTNAVASGATVEKKIFMLRSLYHALQADEIVDRNPFALIKPPSFDFNRKRHTRHIPFDKVREMIDACLKYDAKGRRDKAILAIMFGAGLRLGEVGNLKLGDVQISEKGTPFLLLRETKAQVTAKQALPEWAYEILHEWLIERIEYGAKDNDNVFITPTMHGKIHKENLNVRSIRRMIKAKFEKVGLDPTLYTPHSLRATYGSKMDANQVPLQDIQRAMRHKSPITTVKYLVSKNCVDSSVGKEIDY